MHPEAHRDWKQSWIQGSSLGKDLRSVPTTGGSCLMIQRTGPAFWFACALLVVAAGCAKSPEAKRDKFMRSGKHYLEKREYARAVLDFRNAAAAMPRDAETFYELGLAYIGAQDFP